MIISTPKEEAGKGLRDLLVRKHRSATEIGSIVVIGRCNRSLLLVRSLLVVPGLGGQVLCQSQRLYDSVVRILIETYCQETKG